tara:strand:+ start:596 stop:1162 length:567 start_codon:yes stop_codon:yes gene_type:complete
MTRLIIIILTFLLGGIALSCQNQIQPEANASIEVLSIIDTTKVSVVQLPRPSSRTFTFEEAEKRKNEIFDLQLSTKYFDWKNPTSGGALHINQSDEIEVYQFTMGMMYLGKGVDAKGDSLVYVDQAPKDTSFVIQKEDIKHHVGGVGFGNPASVLITSEYDLKKSKSIELILEEVFEPATQIYYLKKK